MAFMPGALLLDAPAPITLSDGLAERDARLLVAGDYPGKDLKVTEADLDSLVANFSGAIPVKVEHIDSPLDPLGLVERVWRKGDELLGRVRFPASMAAFLAERERSSGGAARLSVGLLKGPAWRLLEASLTLTPHIPTATLLSDNERVELASLRSTVRRQSETLRTQTVDAQIGELKASGRVIPATEALARALLSADDSSLVTLSDGTAQPTSGAFLRFLKAQPPLIRMGEVARAPGGGTALSGGASGAALAAGTAAGSQGEDVEGPEFSDDEKEMFRRLGVRHEDVARTMRADMRARGAL